MNIKMVLFDVGNVIVLADHAITHRYLVEKHNLDLKKAEQFFKIAEYAFFSLGQLDENDFCHALRALLCVKISNEELRSAHDRHIFSVDSAVLNILDRLRKRKCQLGILTDTNMWQSHRVGQLVDLTDYAHSQNIFESHVVELLKHSFRVFKKVASDVGCEPEEILFIDDSEEKIAKAKECGFQTIVYKNAIQLHQALRKMSLI